MSVPRTTVGLIGHFLYLSREGATPYDARGVEVGDHGERCSFDAFIEEYRLTEPARETLSVIVRSADADARGIVPEACGRSAVASGFREISRDDFEDTEQQFPVEDALNAYCGGRLAHGA